jgi:hypothetical protein
MAGQVYSFRSVLAVFFSEAVVRGQGAITHVPTGNCETLPSQDHLPTEPNNWSRQADGFVIQGASRIADPHRSYGLLLRKCPEKLAASWQGLVSLHNRVRQTTSPGVSKLGVAAR